MTSAMHRYRAEWRLVARTTTAALLSFVVAVSMVVFPSRARRLCYERAAAMLRLLGEAVELQLRPPDMERARAIDRLNDRTLAELIGVRTAEQEALRERAISMSDEAICSGSPALCAGFAAMSPSSAAPPRPTSIGPNSRLRLAPPLSPFAMRSKASQAPCARKAAYPTLRAWMLRSRACGPR